LIFVPGASLSAGSRGASSALYAPAGSPHDLLTPQDNDSASSNVPTHDGNALAFSEESTRLPRQSTGLKNNICLNRENTFQTGTITNTYFSANVLLPGMIILGFQ
jgi:hypothetical protein